MSVALPQFQKLCQRQNLSNLSTRCSRHFRMQSRMNSGPSTNISAIPLWCFGRPRWDFADPPGGACRAALKMRAVVKALNEADAFGFGTRGFADPLVRIGVGINTGFACVGNM